MRKSAWWGLLAVGLLVSGCGAVGGGAEQQENRTDRIDEQVHRVEVDSAAGELRLVAGDQASVEQNLRWTGDAKPQVDHRVEGGVLKVTARCPDNNLNERCEAGLVITVPAASSSKAQVSAGAIEVDGLTGEQDVHSSAGKVSGTRLGPGSVSAESSAGAVDLTFADAAPDVRAESSAGSVSVQVPVGPAYHVTAETTAGSTEVSVPDQPGADHRIDARSTAGSVTVAPTN